MLALSRSRKGRAVDFSLTEQTETMLRMIREFVDRELLPMEEAFLRQPFSEILPEVEKKREKVRQMGLWAPGHPREYGGMGSASSTSV